MLGVEHQYAGAHALQDLRIELFQIGYIGRTLFGQALAYLQTACDALDEQGAGEAQRTEGASLHVLGGGSQAAELR